MQDQPCGNAHAVEITMRHVTGEVSVTRSCGRGSRGALWLVHGWRSDSGGEAAQTETRCCGNATPGVAFELPPRRPIEPCPTSGQWLLSAGYVAWC